MMRISVMLCALIASHAAAQVHHLELDSAWRFQRAGSKLWFAAEVPSTVHTDLLRDGLIPDPYWNANADSVRWIESAGWVYARTIAIDSALMASEHVRLVFKGLDTFTTIELNGTFIGSTNNMFRSWTFDVKGSLRTGKNELTVTFFSPIEEGRKARAMYGADLPHDNDPTGVSPFVRKAAYQSGWDFCPRVVGFGIWQPVELRAWSGARINSVNFSQAFSGVEAVVGVKVVLDGTAPAGSLLTFEMDGQRTVVPIAEGADTVRASLLVKDAQRWWPQGEGAQVLYPAQVELLVKGRTTDGWNGSIGLRTVSLDRHAGAFTIVVNNTPVFCKGANLVPPSMFLSARNDSLWIDLVKQMRMANFNMVRVWGGGVYPPDAFFDACDTAGILVWQDLMFANMAPADEAFLLNVGAEIGDQVERIGHHPSLALWCGNNELDVAWKNWGWQRAYRISTADSTRIRDGYEELFERRMPAWIAAKSTVPYISTSPLSNWGNAEGLRAGDLHYWGVWHGDAPFDGFAKNVGRFVSEYGFQSWPDSSLLAHYLPADQLTLGSPMLTRLQRSYKTDRPILDAIKREFGIVPHTLGEFIGLSQQAQAKAYTLAIQAHRAGRPDCMGTLFWQLNDCWPGPSWSAIDFSGEWKPVMRAVREEYAKP